MSSSIKSGKAIEGLIYKENYGPYAPIADGIPMEIYTKDITIENWKEHYDGLLNVFKDAIYEEDLHNVIITINTVDGFDVQLTLFDYFINLMFWYLYIRSGEQICGPHIMFDEDITQNTIKRYMDDFIEPHRKTISNIVLNNTIDDVVNIMHDIDLFSMYMSNTLCLEDFNDLMQAIKEFADAINVDISDVPLEDIKDVGMKAARISIDIIKNRSKEVLGYDHCLADAFRAKQGVNDKQYKELACNIGTKPDGKGSVFPSAINRSFINGGVTTPIDYFVESSTGRTAQLIKLKNVGSSGHFARNLGLNNMDSRLYPDHTFDCHSDNYIRITITNETCLKMFHNRYYHLTPLGMERQINYKKDKDLIGKTIYLRSPITCASAAAGNGVCYKCYGDLAYTLYDVEQGFGINIGRVASEILSSGLTQKLLSAKHLLESSIAKVTWCQEFDDFFEIVDNIIKIAPELDYKDLKLIIDPEAIELENDEDADLTSGDDAPDIYNEYITSFDVLRISTGEVFHISNDRDEKLFLTNEINTIIRKKGDPIDGKFTISFNELKESYLFIMEIQNDELAKILNQLLAILNKKDKTESYPSISDLYQDLVNTAIDGGIDITGSHLEVILMNQIRDPDDMMEKPQWWNHNPKYKVITLNEALTNNPSVIISMSYQKIKRLFFNPSTFNKHKASFMDLFFMERPQRVINGLDDEIKFPEPKPGELFEPLVFMDDPNKITMTEEEDIDSDDMEE